MGKSSLLIWCGNLILQKDLHHVYLILRNLLYLIQAVATDCNSNQKKYCIFLFCQCTSCVLKKSKEPTRDASCIHLHRADSF